MKVKELISILRSLNPDSLVVLSSDSEGNGYSPASDYEVVYYEPESTWNGEIWTIADEEAPEDEYDRESNTVYIGEHVSDDLIPAVVLWPVS